MLKPRGPLVGVDIAGKTTTAGTDLGDGGGEGARVGAWIGEGAAVGPGAGTWVGTEVGAWVWAAGRLDLQLALEPALAQAGARFQGMST